MEMCLKLLIGSSFQDIWYRVSIYMYMCTRMGIAYDEWVNKGLGSQLKYMDIFHRIYEYMAGFGQYTCS